MVRFSLSLSHSLPLLCNLKKKRLERIFFTSHTTSEVFSSHRCPSCYKMTHHKTTTLSFCFLFCFFFLIFNFLSYENFNHQQRLKIQKRGWIFWINILTKVHLSVSIFHLVLIPLIDIVMGLCVCAYIESILTFFGIYTAKFC